MLKKFWTDPVWSKVISTAIVAIFASFITYIAGAWPSIIAKSEDICIFLSSSSMVKNWVIGIFILCFISVVGGPSVKILYLSATFFKTRKNEQKYVDFPAVAANALQINLGVGGDFETKKANGLYMATHTFSVAVRNNDMNRHISNCKLYLVIAGQAGGEQKSYLLNDTFTLNASEERFVPIVSYNEPASVSNHAGTHIRLQIPVGVGYSVGSGWPWQMPLGAYMFTLRVTSKEASPYEAVYKTWVDDENKLHLEKA